ncbi:MAG: DUF6036 family nucleotidyltransferase [Gemmatimonadota bacterium]
MTLATLEAVFRALNARGVRYLVAGGVAVNVHGYQRLTHDLDLVLQLDSGNVRAALQALEDLGYGPLLPVRAEEFADPDVRRDWIETRNLQVFSLVSEGHPGLTVDLFATEPFDFPREYEGALVAEVAPGLRVRFVRLAALIAMKEAASRPRDLDDVEHLRALAEEIEGGR